MKNTWKTEAGGFGQQDHPQLLSEFEVSLDYVKQYFKMGGDKFHADHT